jgi:hypothetical protein
MDQSDDPQELERKIDQAMRIASRVNDQTTVERLRAWIEDLKQRLRQRLEARRTKQAISARAREIWEQNGCPTATWSFGFKPNLRSTSVISSNRTASVLAARPCA